MNQNKVTKRSLIAAGMVLSLTIIGVSGCGSSSTTSSSTAATSQSSTASQQNKGQTAQKTAQNPAMRAVIEISRLQKDQQNPLTSAQKATLKPILQELISTSNPSQDFLQQKANAISAVFTDQQKTYLSTLRTPNGNKPNTQNSNSNSTNANKPHGEYTGRQAGSPPNPQNMYKQVLNSLT